MERYEKIKGFINDDNYTPLTADEMAVLLMVPKSEKADFINILDDLLLSGEIIKSKRGKILSPEKMGYIKGRYVANSRGFGFVTEWGNEDLFISRDASYGAMHGDLVIARITKEGGCNGRPEGEIVRIAKRENKFVVGILRRKNKDFYVEADNDKLWQYINIKKPFLKGALKGQKVYVEIIKYPTDKDKPEGKIVDILGWPESSDVKLKSIMLTYGLTPEFDENVKKEAEIKAKEPLCFKNRVDLRNETIITIDGEDAKDLDDAICIKLNENKEYVLTVCIADVSEYVKEGSALDKEALERGTSVYLPGTVIPMLPPVISNGICSLSEGEERLTLSVEMIFDSKGNLKSHNIFTSVIKSKKRMTYTDVQKIIDGDKNTCKEYSELVPHILLMNELAGILRKKREGFLDFDFPETKLIFDEDFNVIGVGKYEITDANRLIEEFMLAANRTVAEHFYWTEAPFIYRVHENPDTEKIADLKETLSLFNISIKGKSEDIKPGELAKILEKVKDEPYENLINECILRSLKKARYSPDCLGHFGLAAKFYCHFTSPIRRYPDLAIHRIIKEYLKSGTLSDTQYAHFTKFVGVASEKSSRAEVNAQEAERVSTKVKIAEFMSAYLGYEFDGTVSSVTPFGVFVRLPNLVEGLVRYANMHDDYYEFVEKGMYAKGERTGNTYHIGENVKVKLISSNEITGDIDFVMAK